MDRQTHAVDEFTPGGVLVRQYGVHSGSGPGEVLDASGYAWNQKALYILDNRNRRATAYDRTAKFLFSFHLRRGYQGIALVGNDLLAFLPGSDSAAFDFYSREGEFLGGRGRQADLPKCTELSCDRTAWDCVECKLAAIGDSLIAVAEGVTPQVVFFDTSGTRRSSVTFAGLDFMKDWKVESSKRIQEHNRIRRTNSLEFKIFVTEISDMGNGRISMAIIPSRSYLREHGYELWVFRPTADPTEVRRYGYPELHAGFSAMATPTAVFAVDGGEVKQYAFPGRD